MITRKNMWDGFKRKELACKCGCGFCAVDVELLLTLRKLKRDLGNPTVIIKSGCRCEKHNKDIGGADRSRHKRGLAADLNVKGYTPKQVADYLEKEYPGKYGIGRYKTFTHVDVDDTKCRRWGSN